MEENYGLRAYELCNELLLRVSKLENELTLRDGAEIVYDDMVKIYDKTIFKNYLLNALTPCAVKISVAAKYLNGKCKIKAYLNGVKKCESDFTADGDEYFDELNLKKGSNTLRVEYLANNNEFCQFTPVVTVQGLVKQVIEPKRVSVTKSKGVFGYNYWFSFICGDILEYHSFSGEGGDNLQFTVEGVKSAAAITLGGSDYLFYINLSGKLKCIKPSGSGYTETNIGDIYGADVAGYSDGEGAKIFLVKFGDVFVSDFSENASLNFIKCGIKARRVYAENDLKLLITASGGKPSNLIAANRFPLIGGEYTSVTLPKGDNYHFYETDGGYSVAYSQNGVIKKITVKNGGASEPETLTVGDEIIKTDSGALLRSGQNLKETINYKYNL